LGRLSALFLFDVARISRGDGDLLEPLLLTAILQCNQSALPGSPDLQLAYGGAEWALPDEHRRPISVSALAQSLGLPFETVRRRAHALVARGLCVRTSAGLHVPQGVVVSPGYLAVLTARVERLGLLQREIVEAGLEGLNLQRQVLIAKAPRAADRILGDYMLRACEGLMALTGSAMDGVVLLALCAANVRHLDVDRVTSWKAYGDLAAPQRAAALAEELGLSGETVRRHVHRLAQAGFARHGAKGWIADAGSGVRSAVRPLVEANARDLRRMFSALGDLADRDPAEVTRRA